jgi:hypothetical protein
MRLSKRTVQRLAVLYTLSMWRRGAYGPVRVHKTLFFAQKKNRDCLFTFKNYVHGQYSRDVDIILNSLQEAGRLKVHFDGASARLQPQMPRGVKSQLERLLSQSLPEWYRGLKTSFKKFAYMKNEEIIEKAHDDNSLTSSQRDEIICKSTLTDSVEISGINAKWAERLSDLVDARLHRILVERFEQTGKSQQTHANWRELFDDREPD